MIRAASSLGGQSPATRASHPAAANAANALLVSVRDDRDPGGTTQGHSACHPWSLSSYPTWFSARRENTEFGEPCASGPTSAASRPTGQDTSTPVGGTEVCGREAAHAVASAWLRRFSEETRETRRNSLP